MSRSWKVLFYISKTKANPVEIFFEELEVREHTKILRVIQYIQEYGLNAVLPHVKKLSGTPLWEIRILGRDSIRVLYVVPYEQVVLLLHGFRKKTQKTPISEIRIAIMRYRDWKERQ